MKKLLSTVFAGMVICATPQAANAARTPGGIVVEQVAKQAAERTAREAAERAARRATLEASQAAMRREAAQRASIEALQRNQVAASREAAEALSRTTRQQSDLLRTESARRARIDAANRARRADLNASARRTRQLDLQNQAQRVRNVPPPPPVPVPVNGIKAAGQHTTSVGSVNSNIGKVEVAKAHLTRGLAGGPDPRLKDEIGAAVARQNAISAGYKAEADRKMRAEVRAKLLGTSQATGTDGHKFAGWREAVKYARDPNVRVVHLDHGYNRVLELKSGTIRSNRRPDVTAVTYDKKVYRTEFGSKTDDKDKLFDRNVALDRQIRDNGFEPMPPRIEMLPVPGK